MRSLAKITRLLRFRWVFMVAVGFMQTTTWGCQSFGKRNETPSQWISSSAQLLDQVVAVVEGRPITCSEVTLELRIHRASKGECGVLTEFIPAEEKREILGALIDQILVLGEFRRYGEQEVDDQCLQDDFQAIQDACLTEDGLRAFLKSLELTVSELLARRSNTLAAGRWLTARVMQVRQMRTSREGGRDFSREETRPGEEKGKGQEEEILNEILDDLRKRREIRVMDEFGGRGIC